MFALAIVGINSRGCNKGSGGVGGGGGGTQGGGEYVTPMKRKGGQGKATNIGDAYYGRTDFECEGVDACYSVIEREKKRMKHLTVILLLSNNIQVKTKLVDTLHV